MEGNVVVQNEPPWACEGLNLCHSWPYREGGSQDNNHPDLALPPSPFRLLLGLPTNHWPNHTEGKGRGAHWGTSHRSPPTGGGKRGDWRVDQNRLRGAIRHGLSWSDKTCENHVTMLGPKGRIQFKHFYFKFERHIFKIISSENIDLLKQAYSLQPIQVKMFVVSGRQFRISSKEWWNGLALWLSISTDTPIAIRLLGYSLQHYLWEWKAGKSKV